MFQKIDARNRRVTDGNFKTAFLWLTAAMFIIGSCTTVSQPPSRPTTKKSKPSKPYQIYGQWYYPRAHAQGFTQTGLASWYGKDFHGRKTANGEIYNMYGVSAAHKTLPFNTIVKVRNLDNRRELELRINDRGPFVRGRIIDLSYGAAKELGVVGPGTARVEIIALGAGRSSSGSDATGKTLEPIDYDAGKFTFQVGAFRDRSNAENLRSKLDQAYQNAHIATYDTGSGLYYRVRVGFFTSLEEARKGEEILIRDGYEPFVVAE
jgi:rare lipoprotein A